MERKKERREGLEGNISKQVYGALCNVYVAFLQTSLSLNKAIISFVVVPNILLQALMWSKYWGNVG